MIEKLSPIVPIERGLVVIVAGPSSVGKDTVMSEMQRLSPRLRRAVTVTTRQMGKGESEGKPYYFRAANEFQEMLREGKFVEYEQPHDDAYYGSLRSEFEGNDTVLVQADVRGARTHQMIWAHTLFFYLSVGREELLRRMVSRDRGESEKNPGRLARAEREEHEVHTNCKDVCYLINRDSHETAQTMLALIAAKELEVARKRSHFLVRTA